MGSEDRDSRSVSHDRDRDVRGHASSSHARLPDTPPLQDSDLESTQHDGKGEGGGSAGKPGRKKNPK